jgi:hypothetical protein
MNSEQYGKMVAEIARLYVCENKSYLKTAVKTVINLTPAVIFANSPREPTEDELLETVERHNPFAVEDMSEELRYRYLAVCKLELDIADAVKAYRVERAVISHYRLLEDQTRYLTWLEAAPEIEGKKDDEMAEFNQLNEAEEVAHCYTSVMSAVGIRHDVEVVGFNRFHERIS